MKITTRLSSTVLLAALLVGCATTPPPPDFTHATPADVTAATRLTSDPKFDKGVSFEGPQMYTKFITRKDLLDRWDKRLVLLRSSSANGGQARHQVYVDINYDASGWRFYQTASIAGGGTVAILPIQRKVIQCFGSLMCEYQEVFGVPLQDSDLRGSGDLEIRLESKLGGAEVITVPRSYLNGYLAAIER